MKLAKKRIPVAGNIVAGGDVSVHMNQNLQEIRANQFQEALRVVSDRRASA